MHKRIWLIVLTGMLCAFGLPQQFAETAEEASISGLYEICVGTNDLAGQLAYWEQFGYRAGPVGELDAAQAQALYGVNSKLRAVRMLHQDADHGLIRLWQWERPANDGLGLTRLLQPGSRWTSTLTSDVMMLANHAEAAQRAAKPIQLVMPQWSEIYKLAQSEPFLGNIVGVRELIVLQPFVRQMFFQRFGYDAPKYGKVNEAAKFRASQVTHSGLVFAGDDPAAAQFYGDVLGLKLNQLEKRNDYAALDESARQLYGMKPGEYYFGTTLDDPRSGVTPDAAVSGRVLLRRIPTALKLEDFTERARPGSLGYSLYTYRVTNLAAFRAKLAASRASHLTGVLKNEFGEFSVSFRAPDGHSWMLIER